VDIQQPIQLDILPQIQIGPPSTLNDGQTNTRPGNKEQP
jgi:hypothetical protein